MVCQCMDCGSGVTAKNPNCPVHGGCPGCGGNSGCDRNHGSDLRERAEKALNKILEDLMWKAPEQRDDPDIRERWIEWIMDVHQ